MSSKASAPAGNPLNEFLGAGAVYFNLGTVDEIVIGATKGGSQLKVEREIRQVEADGDYGPRKGQRRKVKVIPQLIIKMLELNKVNIPKFYAGMDSDDTDPNYTKIRERLNITDDDYIDNVAFIGQNYDEKDIVVIIYNALGDGSIEWAIAKDEEIVPSVQLTGHYDKTNNNVPYEIWYQKGGNRTVEITVNDGVNPIENAVVKFNGISKLTDADGEVSFTGIPDGTNQTVVIERAGYETFFTAIDVDANEALTFSLTAV